MFKILLYTIFTMTLLICRCVKREPAMRRRTDKSWRPRPTTWLMVAALVVFVCRPGYSIINHLHNDTVHMEQLTAPANHVARDCCTCRLCKLPWGESNSPGFYHFCVRQFKKVSIFCHHHSHCFLNVAFFIYWRPQGRIRCQEIDEERKEEKTRPKKRELQHQLPNSEMVKSGTTDSPLFVWIFMTMKPDFVDANFQIKKHSEH